MIPEGLANPLPWRGRCRAGPPRYAADARPRRVAVADASGGEGRPCERESGACDLGRQAASEPHVPGRSTPERGLSGNWGTGKLRFCPVISFPEFQLPGGVDCHRCWGLPVGLLLCGPYGLRTFAVPCPTLCPWTGGCLFRITSLS